jgi:hypothetical protein
MFSANTQVLRFAQKDGIRPVAGEVLETGHLSTSHSTKHFSSRQRFDARIRSRYIFISPWCSGSAVQLRHYPVTVSAESKAGLYAATGRRASGKVCQAQSTRKSGDRPGSLHSCLSVAMGGPKGARFSPTAAERRIPGIRVVCFAPRASSFAKRTRRPALGCIVSRPA